MKFGGTSVQDAQAIDRISAIVRDRLAEKPVVVVSALAKITDQLLAMAAAAGAGDRVKALDLCRTARDRHYSIATHLLGDKAFAPLAPVLEADFNGLEDLLRGEHVGRRDNRGHRHSLHLIERDARPRDLCPFGALPHSPPLAIRET